MDLMRKTAFPFQPLGGKLIVARIPSHGSWCPHQSRHVSWGSRPRNSNRNFDESFPYRSRITQRLPQPIYKYSPVSSTRRHASVCRTAKEGFSFRRKCLPLEDTVANSLSWGIVDESNFGPHQSGDGAQRRMKARMPESQAWLDFEPPDMADDPTLQLSGFARHHQPVMVGETIKALRPRRDLVIVDGTTGAGGHSEAILVAGANLIAVDRDAEALAFAQQRLAKFAGRTRFLHASFADLPVALAKLEIFQVDGILLDLGISSRQLDNPARGFSFQADGPLDMRLDLGSPVTAADLVNGASAAELTRIFQRYGEEPASARISTAIVRARSIREIRSTTQLAAIVESVVPRHGARHPATRIFQALRMMVNGEAAALHAALESAPALLRVGGRLAVITFHSLEDRAVKRFLRESSSPFVDRPEWPAPRPNPRYCFRLVVRSGIAPSEEEIAANPRARSARLRVAERIPSPLFP